MADLRCRGVRVSYKDPDGNVLLGTTQAAPPKTAPEGNAVVRFDGVPMTWVLPVEVLTPLDGESEKDLICALNAASFEEVRQVISAAEQRLNHTQLYYSGWAVARRAKVKIEHVDFAGHDEEWRITISAKSLQPRAI